MHIPTLAAILCFIPLQSITAQTTAPATQPTPLQALKAEELLDLTRQFTQLPAVGPSTPAQIITLEQQGKRLVARTELKPTGESNRITAPADPNAMWRATVHGDPVTGQSSGFFIIERFDFSDPDLVFTLATVSAMPQQINITGNWERPDGSLQLDLIDRFGSMDEEGGIDTGGVRLLIRGFGLEGDKTVDVRLEAADLTTLRRRHPRLINTYLRPVLRQLGQQQLLAIDPKLAWQVLGGNRPTDPAVENRVRELLPQLDSDAFAERQSAADALRALGEEGALSLMKIDRATLTPEQSAQIDQILATYKQATRADVSTLADDKDFLLDVLLIDNPELQAIALARLNKQLKTPVNFDPTADAPAREKQVMELRQQLLPPPATQQSN